MHTLTLTITLPDEQYEQLQQAATWFNAWTAASSADVLTTLEYLAARLPGLIELDYEDARRYYLRAPMPNADSEVSN